MLGAAVGIVLVATSTVAVRAWAFGSSAGAAQPGGKTDGASLDLPVVSTLGDPDRTSTSLPTVFVRADGTFARSGALGPYNSEVLVEEAILAVLATRSLEALVYRAPPPPLRLHFRIAERTPGVSGFCPGEPFHLVLVLDPRAKAIRERVP